MENDKKKKKNEPDEEQPDVDLYENLGDIEEELDKKETEEGGSPLEDPAIVAGADGDAATDTPDADGTGGEA